MLPIAIASFLTVSLLVVGVYFVIVDLTEQKNQAKRGSTPLPAKPQTEMSATLAAAAANAARPGGSHTVFLTLLGGGVFGNPTEWIVEAIRRAVDLHADVALDVAIVSYGSTNPALAPLLT